MEIICCDESSIFRDTIRLRKYSRNENRTKTRLNDRDGNLMKFTICAIVIGFSRLLVLSFLYRETRTEEDRDLPLSRISPQVCIRRLRSDFTASSRGPGAPSKRPDSSSPRDSSWMRPRD